MPNEHHSKDPICDGLDGMYSVPLHVGAIFVVLFASLIGTGFPLLGKRVPALDIPEYVYVLGKCLGTGVMVAVGFVHLLGDAAQNFRVWCVPKAFAQAYEGWAFLFAVVAVVLMHMIDIVIGGLITDLYKEQEETGSLSDSLQTNEKDVAAVSTEEENPISPLVLETSAREPTAHEAHVLHHSHGLPEGRKSHAQFVVAAVCMEFGTTLHSLFVGLDVGVMNDNKIKPILIALVFHQMFEGLAMGARLADAEFSLSLEMVMMMMFSFSAPLGAAVGTVCVSISKTALTGASYVLTSSILDSLCGGILVYLGLTLMLTDFPADMKRLCVPGTPRCTLKRVGLFAGLWIGAAGMVLIGKWC